MEYPGGKKQHFQHLLFFTFYRGRKAAEAAWDICMVYRESVIGESTARKWFAKLKNGNFDINDMPRSRRPSEFDEDHPKTLLKDESHQTSCELAEKTAIKKQFSIIFIQWDLPKNWESGCLMSLAKTTKKITFKLLLNISPTIEQHAVTNSAFCTKSSREMRNGAYI